MIEPYPNIDTRREKKLAAEFKQLVEVFIPTLRDVKEQGAVSQATFEIAARLASQVTQRLDKAPRRDAIAFFHTLDIPQEAPRTAKVPLVFTLAEKRETSVQISPGVQAAADGKEGEEVFFETTEAQNLTPARLSYTLAVDVANDYIEEPPPQFFQLVPAENEINYQLTTSAPQGSNTLQISPAFGLNKNDIIKIDNIIYRIKDFKDGLVTLAEEDSLENDITADISVVQKVTRFDAFKQRNLQQHIVYIGHGKVLNLEQPSTIGLVVKPNAVVTAIKNQNLAIEWFGKLDQKQKPTWHKFQDNHIQLGDGELLLFKEKGTVDEVEFNGIKSRWLRIKQTESIKDNQKINWQITSLKLKIQTGEVSIQEAGTQAKECSNSPTPSDESNKKAVCIKCNPINYEGTETIKQAFYNATPLPLTTSFFPFGVEPLRFDMFALSAPEALSKKGAKVSLAVSLVDATPAVLEMSTRSNKKDSTLVYAIGFNGKLQVIELTNQGLLDTDTFKWQELGHPKKIPENYSVNLDLKNLRLNPDLSFQVTALEVEDLVFVRDKGERLWVTKVSKDTNNPNLFTHSEWKNILPPIANGSFLNDFIVIKFFSDALLIAATEIGFFLNFVSPEGALYFNEWIKISDKNGTPTYSSDKNSQNQLRVIPIFSNNGSGISEIVLFDKLGVIWRGVFNFEYIEWKKITITGKEVLGSPEVKPVAFKLMNQGVENFFIYGAFRHNRALFLIKAEGDEFELLHPYATGMDSQNEFICNSRTQIILDPNFSLEHQFVVAFGENDEHHEKIAVWLDDHFIELDYPPERVSNATPSGVFSSGSEVGSEFLVINGGNETLYQIDLTKVIQERDGRLNSLMFLSNLVAISSELEDIDPLPFNLWTARSFPRTEKNPELSWEYFNGKGWRSLEHEFNDTTDNLAVSGSICFRVPSDIAVTEIGGKEDFWIRTRLVGGDYGRAKYIATTITDPADNTKTTQTITIDNSEVDAPEVLAIDACFQMDNETDPEVILTENNRDVLNQTQANTVTTASFNLFESASEIDDKDFTGKRALYFGFTQPYNVNPLSLYVNAVEADENVGLAGSNELKFEAFSTGGRWRKVVADDKTKGFTRPGIVKLFANAIPQRSRLFGKELFWLRVSPTTNESSWFPQLKGIYVNAVEAKQANTIKQEILGASNGEPNQRFFLSKPPVIANSLELRVCEALSEEKRLELEQNSKIKKSNINSQLDSEQTELQIVKTYPDIEGEWVLWKQVDSFVGYDGDARIYNLEPATGEVRFGDDKQGKIPPAGRDVVRAIKYQNGGGEIGNVDAFTIQNLKSSIESVDSVINPVAAAGGVDTPSVDMQLITAPDRLRHRQQALTSLDIEALALSFSSEIVRARCLPLKQPNGKIEIYIARRTGERCPKASLAEREALLRFILDNSWGALDESAFKVNNPDYVPVKVTATIIASSSEVVSSVEKEVKDRLLQFLHPISGGPNGTGWPFGRGLWKSDLYRSLSGINGIDRIVDVDLKPEGLDVVSQSALICAENEDAIDVSVSIKGGK